MDPSALREISLTVLWSLRFVFLTQQQRLNCVDVFISTVTALSAAARTPVTCLELHQQPVDAVLCPTFAQKLTEEHCNLYVLPNTVFQIFVFFTEQRQSWLICLIQCQNSRYFGVRFERRKVDKKQTCMKNETYKMIRTILQSLNISAKYHRNRSL